MAGNYLKTKSYKHNSDGMAGRIDELSRQWSCWAEKGKRECYVARLEGIEAKVDLIVYCYLVW